MSRYDLENEPDDLRNAGSHRPRQDSSTGEEVVSLRSNGSGNSGPERPRKDESRDQKGPEPRDSHPRYLEIERSAQLGDSEFRTLTEIGTFRAVNLDDLVRYRYNGDEVAARRELNHLARSGLVRRQIINRTRTEQYSLTRLGYGVAENHRDRESQQVLYHGFVKPKEADHDSAIYRLYQRAAEDIARSGGRVTRIVLDFELKRSINRQLARSSSMSPEEQTRWKQETAEEHGLKVINGRITIPDLRLEYETQDREQNKVDLELVTGHYHAHSLSAKAQAGFRMFASAADRARLRAAMTDPEIMQEILSL